MKKKDLAKFDLPDKPGVYFFLDKKKILYIGKATSLKDRIKSYFSKDLVATRGPLIADMVFKATGIKWQEADSVLEALIMEANLIKRYQPYYNTKEKDDKSFNYVCVTRDKLPKVIVKRGKDLNKKEFASVYGPYTSGLQLKEALKIIRKIFPFYDNKTKQYKEFYKQIELAPQSEEREKYIRNIRNLKLFFAGKKGKILKELEREMKRLAKQERFEDANVVKKQIFALTHINDVALIKRDYASSKVSRPAPFREDAVDLSGRSTSLLTSSFRIEAYDVAHLAGQNMVGVMTVVTDGRVEKDEYRKFKIKTKNKSDDTGALHEVLERRFSHSEWRYPNLIVVDGSTAQMNVAKKVMNEIGVKIPIVGVVKDERHRPKNIKGDRKYTKKYEAEILLANSEAHRFAIRYHKDVRNKNFLGSS